jgi:addiction module RelE/StbE family toxin
MNVRYSPRAIEDLETIRRYISNANPKAAWVVASFIRRSIRVLEEWPYHGRATGKANVRRLTVTNYPYVIFYRVDRDVVILAVMHTARGLNGRIETI